MATKLAKDMVTKFGMSKDLGPLAYGANEDEIFLGRQIARQEHMSEETSKRVDAEVKKIVDAGYEKAKKILTEKDNSTLDDISAELLDDVDLNIEKNVIKILTDVKSSARISNSIKFSKGTIIEISQLSDEWDSDTVKKLYSNLEVLIPPREGKVFDIHLFSSLEPEKYGKKFLD